MFIALTSTCSLPSEESDTEYGSIISSKSRQPSLISTEPQVEVMERLSKISSSSSSSSSSPSLNSFRGTAETPEPVYAEPHKVRYEQTMRVQQPRSSSSSSSSSSNEDLSLTRVVEMEDMEVVEVEEEEPNVSNHSEEERSKPMVASLQEGSPPSRLASYHSEKETVSSGKSSSSSEEEESGEDDVILAEYTGTGEAIEEVGKLEKHQSENPFIPSSGCIITMI